MDGQRCIRTPACWTLLAALVLLLILSNGPTPGIAIEPNPELSNCSACVESKCVWCPFTADCFCGTPESQVKEHCSRSVFWIFRTASEMNSTQKNDRFNDDTCPSIITESHKEQCAEAVGYRFDNLTMADRSVTWSELIIQSVEYMIDSLLGHNDASDIVKRVIDEGASPLLYPFTRSYAQSFVLTTFLQLQNQSTEHLERIVISPIGIYFLEYPTRFIDIIPITANQRPIFSVTGVNDNILYNTTVDSNSTDTTFGVRIPYAGVFGIPGDYAFGIIVAQNRSDGGVQCLFPFESDVPVDHKLRLQSGLSDVQFYFTVFGLFFLGVGIFFVIYRFCLNRFVLPAIATDKPKYKRRGTRLSKLPFRVGDTTQPLISCELIQVGEGVDVAQSPTDESLRIPQQQALLITGESFRSSSALPSSSSASQAKNPPDEESEKPSDPDTQPPAPFSEIVSAISEENPSTTTTNDEQQQQQPRQIMLKILLSILSWLLKTLKQFWNFVMLPDEKIARKKGSDETFFLRFHRMLFWIAFFCTIFFGIPLALIYVLPSLFDADSSRFWKDFASFSAGNIPNSWWPAQLISNLLNGVMFIGILLIVIALMRVGRKFGPTIVKSSYFTNNENGKHASSACTIRISHVSRTCIDSAEFQRHFEEMFGIEKDAPNRIVRAHIALQDRANVLYWIKKYDKWSAQLTHAEEQFSASGTQVLIRDTAFSTWPWRRFIPRFCHMFRKVPAIPVLKARITVAETNIKYGLGKLQGTGHGFVTFCNPECAAAFLKEVQRTPSASFTSLAPQLNTRKWNYKKAPEADDLYWTNLGYSNMYRIFTQSLTIAFILFTAASITTIIVTVTTFLQSKLVEEGDRLNINTTIWEAISDKLRNVLPYYFPTISNFIQVYLVAYCAPFQRHKTKSSEKKTIFIVSTFSLVYYTFFYPLFLSQDFNIPKFLQDGIVVTGQNLFFQQMTVIFLGYLIQYAFLSKGKMLLKTAVYLVWYGIIKRKRKPRILFEDEVYEYVMLVNILLVMLMGTQIPVLLLACFLFFAFNYLVDKALIMFVFQKPGFNSRGAILSTVAWVIGVNVWVFTVFLMSFQVFQSRDYWYFVLPIVLVAVTIINLIEIVSDSANYLWVRFQLASRVVRSYIASAFIASHEEDLTPVEDKSRMRMNLSEHIGVDATNNVDAHSVTYWCPTVSGCPDIIDRFRQRIADDAIFKTWEKEEAKQVNIRAVLVIIGAVVFIVLIFFDIMLFGTAAYISQTHQPLVALVLIPLPTAIGIFGIVAGITRRRRLARYFAIGVTAVMMVFTFLTLLFSIIDAGVLLAISKVDFEYFKNVEAVLGGLSASFFNTIIILISNGILLLIAESFTTALTQRDLIRKERAFVTKEQLTSKPSYTL